MFQVLLCFILLLATLFNADLARAQILSSKPAVILLNPQPANGSLNGSIQITNPNPVIYPNAYYSIKLQNPDEVSTTTYKGKKVSEASQGQLINYKLSERFTLNSGETKQLAINLPVSPEIAPGNYRLQVSLFTDGGDLIGSASQELALRGTGNFLNIQKCTIVVGNIEYDPTSGPNVGINEPVFGKCQVSNPSSVTINPDPTEFSVRTETTLFIDFSMIDEKSS